mgnify:CR=1 FL=1
MDLSQITNAKVYDQDNVLSGLVEKFSIEGRKNTTVTHKTLGQVGILELPARPIQAIKGKVMANHLDRELDVSMMNPTVLQDWQMHKKVDVSDAGGFSAEKSHTLVWHAKFYVIGDDGSDMELGEKAQLEYEISCPFLSIGVLGDADPLWMLDVYNDIHTINGQNVWPD